MSVNQIPSFNAQKNIYQTNNSENHLKLTQNESLKKTIETIITKTFKNIDLFFSSLIKKQSNIENPEKSKWTNASSLSNFDDSSATLFRPSLTEAMLKMEKLEKSIPSKCLDEESDLYFFTAITEKILDPDPDFFETKPNYITILTGELEPHFIPSDASRELRDNLKTARKIIKYVRDVIPFSGNFLQRSRIFSRDYYKRENVQIVKEAKDWARKSVYLFDSKQFNSKQNIKEIFESKTGNCAELSLLGLTQGENVIPVKIIYGDHVFLIIGYEMENSLEGKNLDLEALIGNPNAVICDPWAGSYYPASMLKKYLFGYVGQVTFNGMLYTEVSRFDPSEQSLSPRIPQSFNNWNRCFLREARTLKQLAREIVQVEV